jgi:hypothetical protein
MSTTSISVRVLADDALTVRADVLVLKYAQAHYGIDAAANSLLARRGVKVNMPRPGESVLVEGGRDFGAGHVLFLGVQPLEDFSYAEIRDFGRRAVEDLAVTLPRAKHLVLTLHGAGFGLDETEAFESELAGVVEGIGAGSFPAALKTVTFAERDTRRSDRLQAALDRLLPLGRIDTRSLAATRSLDASAQTTLRTVGYASSAKPRVFVAMPFAPEWDDTFHYGIQGAINAAGMLCERADLASFTGDVMDWVKARIGSARLVVADLSTGNANVYLEVGYAWGKGVPTILLSKSSDELKFDVKSQRCIVYKSIKQLEELLAREITALV